MLPAFAPSTVELIGGLAALLTTVSFLPQVVQTWRSKSAEDLSVGMLATLKQAPILLGHYSSKTRALML